MEVNHTVGADLSALLLNHAFPERTTNLQNLEVQVTGYKGQATRFVSYPAVKFLRYCC